MESEIVSYLSELVIIFIFDIIASSLDLRSFSFTEFAAKRRSTYFYINLPLRHLVMLFTQCLLCTRIYGVLFQTLSHYRFYNSGYFFIR
jgi:hypothetical protein